MQSVASAEPFRGGRKKVPRSKSDIKDIMDHVYVLDNFIADARAQMAQQKKLKYLMVEASK